MPHPRRAAVTLAALLIGAAAARAQPAPPAEPAALRGESAPTRKRLAEAEQKLLAGKAADAADDLQRVLDEAGDDLVSLDGRHFRPARWVAHQLLAKLPPAALASYQNRVDEPARKLLAAGTRDRDPRPLWQLLERYFVSRPAAEGLLALGDLLFERGEFRGAELVWRRLLPDGGADVSHPAPAGDPAATRARVVLAVVFQGERDRAAAELDAFTKLYPAATGTFAGKTGPLADTLRGFLDRPPPAGASVATRAWPTFGGDPARTGRAPGPLPVHWPTRPAWDEPIAAAEPRPAPRFPPFGHPVIADGRAYLADGERVLAFDLATGKATTVHAPAGPSAPTAGGTLTAAGGRLYARLGPATFPTPAPGVRPEESAVVCFAPSRAGPLRELWRVTPPAAEGKGPGVWEGTPLVAGGRMWVALARAEGGRVVHAVACFDPADPDAAPDRPAWVAEVCDSPLSPAAEARGRHELLTLAGRHVVFSSNDGAVAAVDAATGRRAWGFQYPRAARRAADLGRGVDPAPAVAAGGRVFVAPADADRVYALDAETGRPLWETGPTEGAQLLGVSRGRLVYTTTGPVRGIRAASVVTGSYRDGGWVQGGTAGPLGYGRGFVTDAAVVWPSRVGLLFLDPDTGRPLVPPLGTLPPDRGLFGNVAYADGVLVAVTPTRVRGYTTDAPPFARPPAPPADPRARFEAIVDGAEQDLATGNEPAARERLRAAVAGDFPKAWRAWAAARLLLLDAAEDTPVPPPDLAEEWLLTARGEFVTLGALADRHAVLVPRDAPGPPSPPVERKPPDPPRLAPTARVREHVALPPSACPLAPIAGAVHARNAFIAAAGELLAVDLDTGEKAAYPTADQFTHAADTCDGFVAAGPLVVAVYGPDRQPVWVFRVPDTDPLPDRPGRRPLRTGDRPPPPVLSSFTLSGPWLFARVGDHHLLALDLAGRRVGWVLGACGRPGFEPVVFPGTPRFEPHLWASGSHVAAQRSDGRRWTIRADTGRVRDEVGTPTARAVWVHPPVKIGRRVAFSDGPGLVRLVRGGSGRVTWVYDAGGDASLAGEPPQVRGWGDAVLVAVRRNHGVDLDRVDRFEGKSAWGGAVFLDAARVDLQSADADALRVYVPVGGKLLALGRDDGKPAWEAALPDGGGWVVRAGRRVVVAYPAEAVPAEPLAAVWVRVRASFLRCPLPWRLPWLAAALYDAWADRSVTVLLFDPETGKLLRTLGVPARGPAVAAWFDGDRAVVATGDRVAWVW